MVELDQHAASEFDGNQETNKNDVSMWFNQIVWVILDNTWTKCGANICLENPRMA